MTEFITKTFPQELIVNLDLKSLELENKNYIDDELKEHFSDLVYHCKYQSNIPVKIVLLFEHKSYQNPLPPIHFQLLRYMLNIWEQNLSQNEPLSPIIPIIIYHGKKSWEKRELSTYFTTEKNLDTNLQPFLPQFDYLLTDLTLYQEAEIKQVFKLISLQSGLLLMKKIFEKQLENDLKLIFESVNELLKTEKGKRIFTTLLLYLFNASKIQMNKIMTTMHDISLEAENESLTLAKRLILEGEKKGEKKGEKTKEIKIITNMLQKGLNAEQIADLTGIPLLIVKEIQKKQEK